MASFVLPASRIFVCHRMLSFDPHKSTQQKLAGMAALRIWAEFYRCGASALRRMVPAVVAIHNMMECQ